MKELELFLQYIYIYIYMLSILESLHCAGLGCSTSSKAWKLLNSALPAPHICPLDALQVQHSHSRWLPSGHGQEKKDTWNDLSPQTWRGFRI